MARVNLILGTLTLLYTWYLIRATATILLCSDTIIQQCGASSFLSGWLVDNIFWRATAEPTGMLCVPVWGPVLCAWLLILPPAVVLVRAFGAATAAVLGGAWSPSRQLIHFQHTSISTAEPYIPVRSTNRWMEPPHDSVP